MITDLLAFVFRVATYQISGKNFPDIQGILKWYLLNKLGHCRWISPMISNMIHISRSSRLEVFCQKGVFRNFPKFTGKHLCQCLFFNKRDSGTGVFLWVLWNFWEHLLSNNTSGGWFIYRSSYLLEENRWPGTVTDVTLTYNL